MKRWGRDEMSLPIVGLEGRVTGEVQLKFADSGKAVARIRVKAADRVKNGDKWEDGKVLWVTVTAFGPLAEHAAESLADGDQVVVLGRWSTAEWTDADGMKRSAPRLEATALGVGLQFAPRRHSGERAAKQARPPERPEGVGLGATYVDAAVAASAASRPVADDPWA